MLSWPPPTGNLARVAFFAYLAVCYFYALRLLVLAHRTERSSVMARQILAVAAGVAIVVVTRLALLVDDLRPELAVLWGPPGPAGDARFMVLSLAIRLASLALLVAWCVVHVRRIEREERRAEARAAARVAGAFVIAVAAAWIVGRGIYIGESIGWWDSTARGLFEAREISESLAYAVRWVGFCGAMGIGVVRYQVLSVDARALAAGTLVMGLGAAFAAVGLAATLAGPWTAASVAVASAVGAILLHRRRDRAPSPQLHARALDVYRAFTASRIADGRASEGPDVAAVRARLGISPAEHEMTLAIAQVEHAGAGPPRRLGRFRVVRRLGAGAFARVLLAVDERTGGAVALKQILGSDAAAVEAAARELDVARRVSHPGLLPIHEIVHVGDSAVLVMDYAEGGSLRDLLDREKRLSAARARTLLLQVLDALHAMHEAGLVHGDVKPENVLLTREGEVRLTDFGSTRRAARHDTIVTGGSAGTPGYIAPEVLAGEALTEAADVYAVGVIARELLGSDVSPLWAAILDRATAPVPTRRFPSAASFTAALVDVPLPRS